MNRKNILISAILALSLLGAGCSLTQTVNVNSAPAKNTNQAVNTNISASITYAGQNGKNALDLLKSKHTVDVSSAGFVNAIDGRQPVGKQYWAFYINGKLSDVGAKDYITKDTDSIEWKLVAY